MSGTADRGRYREAGGAPLFRGLARDLLAYGVGSGLARASGLILLPILARALTVAQYGMVDALTLVMTLHAVAIRLALPGALTRFLPETRSDREAGALLSSHLVLVTVVGTISTLALSIAAPWLTTRLLGDPTHADTLRLGIVASMLLGLTALPETALRMQRRVAAFNAVQLSATLLHVVLATLFVVRLGWGLRGLFTSLVIAYALQLALGLYQVRGHLTAQLSRHALRRSLAFSLPMYPSRFASWLSSQVDRILLLALLGVTAVGLFGAVSRIAAMAIFAMVVVRNTWTPVALRLLEAPERDAFCRCSLSLFCSGFSALGIALTALGPLVFQLLTPAEYHGGLGLLPWLVGAALATQAGSITSLGLIISQRTGLTTVATVLGGVVNVMLSFALIRWLGLQGAAIGSFAAALLFSAFQLVLSQRLSSLRFDSARAMRILLVYTAVCLLLNRLSDAAGTVDGVDGMVTRLGLALVGIGLIAVETYGAVRSYRTTIATIPTEHADTP